MGINNVNDKNNPIFKDYVLKIKSKSFFQDSDIIAEDVNNLIILLNWCFHKKNNFFISDFNKKNIYPICISYNQLKTNILSKELFDNVGCVFQKINGQNLKTLKFVLHQFINNYDEIGTDTSNTELCQKVTKQSIKNCLGYINSIQFLEN